MRFQENIMTLKGEEETGGDEITLIILSIGISEFLRTFIGDV